MKKQLWMLIVVFLALLVGCTEVSEDTGDEDYNQSSGTSTSYTVRFCTNSIADWDSVYVYAWNGSDSNAEWPGKLMSSESGGWYSATVSYSNVIFNDGSSNQTEDLTAQNGYFLPQSKSAGKVSGTWYTSKPNLGNNPEPDYPEEPDDPEPDYPDDPYYPDEPEEISAPSSLSAYATSESSISLSWSYVSGATFYLVYYGTSNSIYNAECYDYYTGTSAQITKLSAGTTYYFWVIATDGTLKSDFSNMEYAMTEEEKVIDLATPNINGLLTRSNILTTDKKGFSIKVYNDADHVDSRTEKYRLYRSQEKFENYEMVKEVNVSDFSFVFEDRTVDMIAGNVYYYRVSAVCGKSEKRSSHGIEIVISESMAEKGVVDNASRQKIKFFGF